MDALADVAEQTCRHLPPRQHLATRLGQVLLVAEASIDEAAHSLRGRYAQESCLPRPHCAVLGDVVLRTERVVVLAPLPKAVLVRANFDLPLVLHFGKL